MLQEDIVNGMMVEWTDHHGYFRGKVVGIATSEALFGNAKVQILQADLRKAIGHKVWANIEKLERSYGRTTR